MFSNPLYLFALAGLTIPIAIHLLSRKEGKVIKLGSIRHVVETSTQQFKGIKLNELILLALRCAMIIVFSLLLSGLQCTNSGNEKWVIIEKDLKGFPNLNSVLDSLESNGYSAHLLAKGFPELKDSSISTEINYWQLVEELKQKDLSDAVVFSKNNVNHFKGMRKSLPKNVRWISQPSPSIDFPVRAVRIGSDSVSLLTGHSSAAKTYFTTERIIANACPIPISPQDTIKIVLVSDGEFNYDQKVIKAALHAIEKLLTVKIVLIETDPTKPLPTPTDWCIWLSSSEKSEGLNAKKNIKIKLQASNELIVKTDVNQWVITKRLNQEVALHHNLTMELAVLLLPEKNLEEKIAANDRRTVSDSLAWGRSYRGKEIQASIQAESADKYLIFLLLALLFIERILAYRRNQ
jgi:hypothetical protein